MLHLLDNHFLKNKLFLFDKQMLGIIFLLIKGKMILRSTEIQFHK